MLIFFKRALQDILTNRFLHGVTTLTIALSILIVSAFVLLFVNISDIMTSWKQGIKLMAYLKAEFHETAREELIHQIGQIDGIKDIRFISKSEALEQLKAQLRRQSSLLENLVENPLPDSLEIQVAPSIGSWQTLESMAQRIQSIPLVDEVEYAQQWLGRFANLFNLFRLAGFAIGGIFFLAAVFIVSNTIRLVIYSRREEFEIMRLVGASDGFITAPLYIEGLFQGILGGMIGLSLLFVAYIGVSANVEKGIAISLFHLRFLSFEISAALICGSMLVGWLGCFFSLKQHLKA